MQKYTTKHALPLSGALLLYLVIVLRSAWLTDDAYISFRTIDNFINGYGLTWNTAERVQTFTHPLWVLLISAVYWVTDEIYYTCIFLSAGLCVATLLLIARTIAHSPATALLGILILSGSKAFIDYSTSGLENPLSYLLLALFAWLLFTRDTGRRKLTLLSLVAGLGAVNRMDTLLLFLPGLLYETWRGKNVGRAAILKALVAGFTPFILWECLALFYYGFLFPNTAYAKLGTGIPRLDLFIQGLYYLEDALYTDPLLLPTVGVALGLSLRFQRGPIWP
jgi:arabinofuranosyltransferase